MRAYIVKQGVLGCYLESKDEIVTTENHIQFDVMRQLLSTVGKCVVAKGTIFCILKEDLNGSEKKVLKEIVQLFQLLWQELDGIEQKRQENLQQDVQF